MQTSGGHCEYCSWEAPVYSPKFLANSQKRVVTEMPFLSLWLLVSLCDLSLPLPSIIPFSLLSLEGFEPLELWAKTIVFFITFASIIYLSVLL